MSLGIGYERTVNWLSRHPSSQEMRICCSRDGVMILQDVNAHQHYDDTVEMRGFKLCAPRETGRTKRKEKKNISPTKNAGFRGIKFSAVCGKGVWGGIRVRTIGRGRSISGVIYEEQEY